MIQTKYPPAQSDPPRPAKETLPTMYDLPSEYPEEPGLPDDYHDLQAIVLRLTFKPPNYSPQERFSSSDLNIYYDVRHPKWHKRPDWFAVVGVPPLYQEQDLRLSYVIWQEGVTPCVVVELLSPSTENEDLGQTVRAADKPPTKWEAYEQVLRVPYYIVFDRYTDSLRAFVLVGNRYQEQQLSEPRIWIPTLELGLGLWYGEYQTIERQWLRWYDAEGNWIPLPEEQAEEAQQEAQQAQQEAQQAQQEAQDALARVQLLEEFLQSRGIDPDALED